MLTGQRNNHDIALPVSSGPLVVLDDGIQVKYEIPGPEAAATEQYSDLSPTNSADQNHQTRHSRRIRRKWLIFGIIGALLIVLAAVLGGVLGSRANKKSSPATSSTLSFTSSSPSSPSSPSSNANTLVQGRHNLTAVSFALNSVNYTRVYYQDNAGEILEAASSSQNSTWINTHLGFSARNGTAIGAAVYPSKLTPVSFLFFFFWSGFV